MALTRGWSAWRADHPTFKLCLSRYVKLMQHCIQRPYQLINFL
jgi:hypothetical protein